MGLRRFFLRRREDADLAREMEAHIGHQVDENMSSGMPEHEARREAYLKLGSPRRVREDIWQWNTLGFFDSVLRDLRYALRTLRRSPGFTLVAVVVMALGIGANTALFSMVRSVLLQPLPFREPDRLVTLYERSGDGKYPYNVVAAGIFGEWQKLSRGFEQMALVQGGATANLSGSGGQLPEKMSAALCSWNFFSILGVQPAYGRTFTAADDNQSAPATVILSWGLWKRRFGGDASIVGQSILLDGRPYTVIGIMPAWFSYPNLRTQMWWPVNHERSAGDMQVLDNHQYSVVARLKPGTTMRQGVSDIDLIERRIHDANPTKTIGSGASIRPLLEDVVGDYRTPLYVLLAATGCVLLIACLNVANLLVARSAARRREVAIRSALGGSRARLLREQLMESVVLCTLAGLLGIGLAHLAVRWVVHTRQDMPRVDSIHIDGTVLLFALGVTLLSGLMAGLISALPAVNRNTSKVLQESSRLLGGGHSRARLRKLLLSVEVGLTVVLLLAAGLLLKSYQRLRSQDLGCATDQILTLRIGLPGERYQRPVQVTSFYEQLVTGLRSLPGVEKAGLITTVPGAGWGGDNIFTITEHPPLLPGQFQDALRRAVEPGYFQAMQIPLLQGRTFTDAERLDQAHKVIVSALLVRQFFAPGEDPIGKHLRGSLELQKLIDYEIVGVVGDTRHWISEPIQPMMYFPIYSGEFQHVAMVVHAQGDPNSLAVPIQKLIAGMDPELAVSDVLTMDQVVGRSTTDASFNATLVLAFAVLSLVLASVGLYGVLSYMVTQRTGEIGIRMALGAPRASVVRLMLADGLQPAALGLICGLIAGGLVVRVISDMLYGTQPLDASVFSAVTALLALVASVACVLPAWRASRLDAMQALRTE
jgi:putative ABC transport system permease protein